MTENESKFQGLRQLMSGFSGLGAGVVFVDNGGSVLEANIEFISMTGLERDAVIGAELGVVLGNPGLAKSILPIARNEGKSVEGAVGRENGRPDSWIRVAVGSSVVIDGESLVPIILEDRGEERRLRLAKAESDTRADRVFEALRDGWIETDMEGHILRVNQATLSMLGYEENELKRMTFWDITPPEYYEREKKIIEGQIIANGCSSVYRKEYVTRDGRRIPVELSVYLTKDESGELSGMWGLVRDVSDKQSVQELNDRLVAAVEHAAEAIVVSDLDANILYVNPAFEKITGYSRSEVLGKNPRILQSGNTPVERYDQMWSTLRRGEVWQGVLINKRKDGSEYQEEASISPVRNAEGKVVSYVALKRDISRELELEEQLRQSQKMEAVGKLAGGVAHDFNNLLMVMMTAAEFAMEDAPDGSEIGTEIETILDASRKASALTRQLLAFSRRQSIVPREIDLNDLVLELQKMLGRLIGEDIKLAMETSGDPCRVKADPGQIEQVIVNLAVNARDAMPNGGHLTIGVSHVTMTEDLQARFVTPVTNGHKRFAVISIEDTGEGMDEATRQQVFEPFFTTKEKGRGTGLGLSTVYGIVRQHDGQILVDSHLDVGTVFRVFLPELETSAQEEDEIVAANKLPTGTETILFVEDNAAVRKMATRMLGQLGYNVVTAASGEEAVECFEEMETTPLLLLTDVVMPGIDGPELADILRASYPELRVIYASGYPESHARRLATLPDTDSLLHKPFTLRQLAEMVRGVLDG